MKYLQLNSSSIIAIQQLILVAPNLQSLDFGSGDPTFSLATFKNQIENLEKPCDNKELGELILATQKFVSASH